MKYFVAIKRGEFTEKFCFETEAERKEFIQVTKNMHPETEILLSEEHECDANKEYHAFTA